MKERSLLSVVVPVYDESAGLGAFHERTTKALEQIAGVEHELVYVDDGSGDASYALLAHLAQRDARVRVIKLSRNFGHQIAITAGLDHARGDAAVVIDADLQDPPELIGKMVDEWRAGHDVVYGVRRVRRGDAAWKRLSASLFYRVLGQLTGFSIPVDAGDFRLMSRRALDELCRMREKDRYVRGLVSWIGFPQTGVPYERDERFAGETKYPLGKRVRFALDAIASFSMAPLKLATWLGFGTAAVALGVLALALAGRMAAAWAPLLAAVLLLGAVQLICLGILGEYLGRIFNEIKPRPNYIVEARLGGDAETPRPTARPYPWEGPEASGP